MIADGFEKEPDCPHQNPSSVAIRQWRVLNGVDINDRCRHKNQQDALKEKNLKIASNIEAAPPFLSPFAVAKIFRLAPIPEMNVERKTDRPYRHKSSNEERPAEPVRSATAMSQQRVQNPSPTPHPQRRSDGATAPPQTTPSYKRLQPRPQKQRSRAEWRCGPSFRG